MRNRIIEEDLKYIVASGVDWNRLYGKTILISGANGFLPSYLVHTLLFLNERRQADPIKVIGVVRNKGKAQSRFTEYLDRPDFRLIVQDICQPLTCSEKIDYIIHAASQASPVFYSKDPVGTLSANILGTYNLLELARNNRVEGILFFSSGEVYGEVLPAQIPTAEDSYGYVDPANVRSCYAESKRMGETMCVSWHHQYGVPAKIVRPFHTYGPGMNLDDGRVFADFVSNIVHGQNIIMRSDGSATRAFCYLADATAGFFMVMLHGKPGEAYNVGNDQGEISILNLANMLVGLFPEKNLAIVREEQSLREGYVKSRISRACPDISKIRALGWQPTHSVKDGFSRTIRSFLL